MGKTYAFILCILFATVSFAENLKPVAQKINERKSLSSKFREVKLFDVTAASSQRSDELKGTVRNATVMEFRAADVQTILRTKPDNVLFSIPTASGQNLELELFKTNFFSPDFSVVTSDKDRPVAYEAGAYYWGIIKGDNSSLAAISIFENEVMGTISSSEGNFVLGKLENESRSMHILYNDRNLNTPPKIECSTSDDGNGYTSAELSRATSAAVATTNCIRLYWESNYDLYQNKGSVTNVTNYLTGLFNQSAIIYTNDSIPVTLTQLYVWSTASPYVSTTTSALLSDFQTNRNSFNGDLGHLIGLAGGGGIAAGFSGLCNSNLDNSMCYSGVSTGYNNVPTYSWSVEVVTHEQGHLMGSRHTHACVWNGNNTAIDNCGPTAGYGYEGSCSAAPTPTNGGTIMSYCHLVSGVGINFNNGFGSQPRTVILNKFNAATCLTSCSGTTCLSPLGPVTSNLTTTSATFNWSSVTGAQGYNIQYRIVGASTWITGTTTNLFYNVSGLTTNANYEWQVQTICTSGNSSWTVSTLFTASVPPTNDNPCSATPISVNSSCVYTTFSNLNATATTGTGIPAPGCASYAGGDVWFSAIVPAGGAITFGSDNLTMTDGAMAIYSGTCSSMTLLACQDDGSGTNGYMPMIALTGQTPGATLWVRFWSYSNNTNGTFKLCASYPASTCNAPTNMSTSSITTSSATFNWASVSGAVSYNIQYRVVGASTWLTGTATPPATSFAVNGLTATSNYEWQIQTVCSGGSSAFTSSTLFTTLTPPCNAPTNLSTTLITTSSATFNWGSVSGAVSYNIQYRIVGTSTWSTGTALSSATSFPASGLSATSNYEWQIQTVCSGGSSSFTSSTLFTTPAPPCSAPSNLSTSAITTSAATFNWGSVSGAVSYNIQYRIVGTSTWSTGTALSSATSFPASGLSATSDYEWQIQTVCSGGSSAFTSSTLFTTLTPPCNAPGNLSTTVITTSSATFNWGSVSGAVSYNIQYRIVGTSTWSTGTALSSATSFPAAGLTPGSNYEWQIQTVCSGGSSSFTSSSLFATKTAGCSDAYEPNNSKNQTALIAVATDVTGLINPTGEFDWFRFTNTTALHNIKITLTNLPADYDVQLYPNNGNYVAISQTRGTTAETIVYNTNTVGTWKIRVSGYKGAFNASLCYTLRVELSGSIFAMEHGRISGLELSPVKQSLNLYPNPAKENLSVEFSSSTSGKIKINVLNLIGQHVLSMVNNSEEGMNTVNVNTSQLIDGIYILEMENNGEVTRQRFSVSK